MKAFCMALLGTLAIISSTRAINLKEKSDSKIGIQKEGVSQKKSSFLDPMFSKMTDPKKTKSGSKDSSLMFSQMENKDEQKRLAKNTYKGLRETTMMLA